MKKKIAVFLISGILLFTGCGNSKKNIVEEFKKKVNKLESYHVNGTLEVTNNESTYKYDIDVAYQDDEKYRVSLKNKTNDHEQIILKNASGVYVLTPSLNKSFKFQSEWPYNNSQSYLYQTILNDMESDNKNKVEETKNGYIVTTKVNYSNNKELTNQKIYLDKKANITKVEVLNKNGIVKIKMNYSNTDLKAKFDDNYFELNTNTVNDTTKKSSKELSDIIYPLYIPDKTYLDSQKTVETEAGKRTILTFAGDKPFTLIEQVANQDNNTILSVYGDLQFVNDVVGILNEKSVNWISDGIEYYAVSDTLDKEQLLEVANSVNTITVGK